MAELVVKPELCVECGLCERNCLNNAIHVYDSVPLFCMHCNPERAPCLQICPKGAIEEVGGAITINDDKCIGCKLCQEVCPIGAITINEVGQARKCDLCKDHEFQHCVDSCPTGALVDNSENVIAAKQEKLSEGFKKIQSFMK